VKWFGRLRGIDALARVMGNPEPLGERQDLVCLPLGLIMVSYLGSTGERSSRASYGFISVFDRRMPFRLSPLNRFAVGWRPHHLIRCASRKIAAPNPRPRPILPFRGNLAQINSKVNHHMPVASTDRGLETLFADGSARAAASPVP